MQGARVRRASFHGSSRGPSALDICLVRGARGLPEPGRLFWQVGHDQDNEAPAAGQPDVDRRLSASRLDDLGQHLAEPSGVGRPERALEPLLRALPRHAGGLQRGLSGRGEAKTTHACIVLVHADRDQAVALERTQVVRERGSIITSASASSCIVAGAIRKRFAGSSREVVATVARLCGYALNGANRYFGHASLRDGESGDRSRHRHTSRHVVAQCGLVACCRFECLERLGELSKAELAVVRRVPRDVGERSQDQT